MSFTSTMGSHYRVEIAVYTLCNRSEFNWQHDEDDFGIPAYNCTLCSDHARQEQCLNSFNTLHRRLLHDLPMPFSIDLFDHIYPTTHKQLKFPNKDNREQRVSMMRWILSGAPWTRNSIYDLHQKINEQIRRGHIWKGRRYHPTSWNDRTDLFSAVIDYLT